MSHHVSASPSNPTGAVEVVRVSNAGTTTAPVDTGSAAGATAPAATSTTATPPVSGVVGGQPATAGQSSGMAGANLPVADIQQASNTIQNAQADLSVTAGAERRLDGFDLVGGDGGGGGDAGQENANNAEGAVAQDNPDVNQLEQERVDGATSMTSQAELDPNTSAVATGGTETATTVSTAQPEQDLRSVQDANANTTAV